MFRFHRRPMSPETRRMVHDIGNTIKVYGLGVFVGYVLDRLFVIKSIDLIVDAAIERGINAGVDNYNKKLMEAMHKYEGEKNVETGEEN